MGKKNAGAGAKARAKELERQAKRKEEKAKRELAEQAKKYGLATEIFEPDDVRKLESAAVPFPCPGCRSMSRVRDTGTRALGLLDLARDEAPDRVPATSFVARCDNCGRISVVVIEGMQRGAAAIEMAATPNGGWEPSIHALVPRRR